jgi:hypothetical protein
MLKHSTLALQLAILLASGVAWAESPKVPTELQDIWCADRKRLSGLVEAKCFRFGPDYIVVEGDRADRMTITEERRNIYRVMYSFADVIYEVLVTKHRDYIDVRDRDGAHWGDAVRHNRGNPYAEFYDK